LEHLVAEAAVQFDYVHDIPFLLSV
jgi:hypothetical protein